MNRITTERWAALKCVLNVSGIVLEFVDPMVENCKIGVDDEGCLHLFIAIDGEPDIVPQELEGVVVQIIETDRLYLDIYAKGHYEMIFTPMANQIFQGVAFQGRAAVAVVLETIDEFRAALKPLKPALTITEQIGLFGELWVLRNVLIPTLGFRACVLWSGPELNRHDFIGNTAHIEVKTTVRSEDRHEISRIDQLRAPQGKRLLFASIQLERTDDGEKSLSTLIDEVYELLGNDSKAIDLFQAKLSRARWHDGLRQSGDLKRFNLRDVQFFEVEGSFPRLPDDYIPPRGIVAIRYTIDISSRSILDRDTVRDIIRLM